MDQRSLFDAIFGDRAERFEIVWPLYHQFLQETHAHKLSEAYFLDKGQLINDFYRWLHENHHSEELKAIDRRSGTDRRGGLRSENPGRRREDQVKNEHFFQKEGDSPFPK